MTRESIFSTGHPATSISYQYIIPIQGCDECLVAINYFACHEIGRVCFDENREEINQKIKCLTEKEFNQMKSNTHANQCITDFHDNQLFPGKDFSAVPARRPCPSESI